VQFSHQRSHDAEFYYNAFAPHHALNALNVRSIVMAVRTRWKVENEGRNINVCTLNWPPDAPSSMTCVPWRATFSSRAGPTSSPL
jgi:hypothetical protein